QWEAYLKRIKRGTAPLEPFLKGIEDYVREVVGKVGKTPLAMKAAMVAGARNPQGLPVRPEPVTTVPARTSESLGDLLHSAFGFSSFRPNQEAVAGQRSKVKTCCWSCRPGRGSPCATNCPESREA